MKIKITQTGWAGYTGHLGQVEFADGISIDDVSRADAAQLSAIVLIEDVATGKNPSDAQRIVDSYSDQAKVETPLVAETTVQLVSEYDQAQLEAIADASGIKGVREIADRFDIKGTSITDLITRILNAQSVAALAAK